jgi:hypothetical protein
VLPYSGYSEHCRSAGTKRESVSFGARHSVVSENLQVVILSGVAGSQREAATQSKDPYRRHNVRGPVGNSRATYNVKLLGVLRLHQPIRKRMGWLRSG